MNPVKTPTQLWLTQDLLERADALIEVMAVDPEVRALGMPTRTAVLRLAIALGLQDLERQYQPPAPADASAPHPTTPHDATPRLREGTLSHVYEGRDGEDQASGLPRDGHGVSAPAPKGP
ncbi:MAG: hypothetical protein ACRERE_23335 [Candidatus Entotheonellia bacterium]